MRARRITRCCGLWTLPVIDVESLVQGWVAATFPEVRSVTELPDKFEKYLPVVRVERVGGANSLNLDRASVQVEVFAGTVRDDARKLAESIRDAVTYRLRGYEANGAVVKLTATLTAPAILPYENPSVRRCAATYYLWVKDA